MRGSKRTTKPRLPPDLMDPQLILVVGDLGVEDLLRCGVHSERFVGIYAEEPFVSVSGAAAMCHRHVDAGEHDLACRGAFVQRDRETGRRFHCLTRCTARRAGAVCTALRRPAREHRESREASFAGFTFCSVGSFRTLRPRRTAASRSSDGAAGSGVARLTRALQLPPACRQRPARPRPAAGPRPARWPTPRVRRSSTHRIGRAAGSAGRERPSQRKGGLREPRAIRLPCVRARPPGERDNRRGDRPPGRRPA